MSDAVLIAPAALDAILGDEDARRSVAVLDVRWSLASPDGRAEFEAGHLPGAVYVDLETELSSHGAPTDGRHPLPTRDALQAAARGWGLRRGQEAVVYDGGSGWGAARAWWLLRHAGVRVRILDGGLASWTSEGRDVVTGATVVDPGDVELSWGGMREIDADTAAAWPKHGVLLDARAGERYRGEVEPIDPAAGHIPGAVSAPTTDNVAADGRLIPASALSARFATMIPSGADVAVYCGSGVSAAHQIAALATIGVDAALYAGSWSAWSQQGRPVATGAQ